MTSHEGNSKLFLLTCLNSAIYTKIRCTPLQFKEKYQTLFVQQSGVWTQEPVRDDANLYITSVWQTDQ